MPAIGSSVRPIPRPSATQPLVILLAAVYFLNLGYGFNGSFRRLSDYQFISHSLGGEAAHTVPGNCFRETWIGAIPVPVPGNYLKGIEVQKYDFERGKWSYLRGETKQGGWYHYYLYALATKTPIGTLLMLGSAVRDTIQMASVVNPLKFNRPMSLTSHS